MSDLHLPRRAVSLYSYQQEYFLGQMTFDDCLAACSATGATGVEIIGEQMVHGFPTVTDAFARRWRQALAQHRLTPLVHDMFLDYRLPHGQVMTDAQMLESVERDIVFAARLGCPMMRVIVITPPHIVEAALPCAERHGVRMLLEVHSPWHFHDGWIQSYVAIMRRTGSPFIGLMPDLGIFVERFPRIITARAIRDGADPTLCHHIAATYDAGGDVKALPDYVARHGGDLRTIELARTAGHFIALDPAVLLDFMPYIQHIHGKFYEMVDGEEYSIPYPRIMAVLKQGKYAGYIASEYEGQRHIQDCFPVDSVAQVQQHQQMLAELIGAGEASPHV